MLYTNVAELRLLFNTFTLVWSSGGQANLSLQTKDSQVWAKLDLQLDLQLGPADGHRPGPPEAVGSPGAEPVSHQEQLRRYPHLHPQARGRGPAARAQDARRGQDWLQKHLEPAQDLGTNPKLTEWGDRVWIEYVFEVDNVQMEMYQVI